MAVPREYANVMSVASVETFPETAKLITEANIGPTHGVHSKPNDKPINNPPKNPLFVFPCGANLVNDVNDCSKNN
jgi:hypothetical protein